MNGCVIKFVIGADLMLPGITSISPSFIKEKEKVAIKIAGNPLPFAGKSTSFYLPYTQYIKTCANKHTNYFIHFQWESA
jgi:hypothetical protein